MTDAEAASLIGQSPNLKNQLHSSRGTVDLMHLAPGELDPSNIVVDNGPVSQSNGK